MHASDMRLRGAQWRRSRHSGKQGTCVELAPLTATDADSLVALRNSRFPSEPVVVLSRADLCAFLADVKRGRFDDVVEGS